MADFNGAKRLGRQRQERTDVHRFRAGEPGRNWLMSWAAHRPAAGRQRGRHCQELGGYGADIMEYKPPAKDYTTDAYAKVGDMVNTSPVLLIGATNIGSPGPQPAAQPVCTPA